MYIKSRCIFHWIVNMVKTIAVEIQFVHLNAKINIKWCIDMASNIECSYSCAFIQSKSIHTHTRCWCWLVAMFEAQNMEILTYSSYIFCMNALHFESTIRTHSLVQCESISCRQSRKHSTLKVYANSNGGFWVLLMPDEVYFVEWNGRICLFTSRKKIKNSAIDCHYWIRRNFDLHLFTLQPTWNRNTRDILYICSV